MSKDNFYKKSIFFIDIFLGFRMVPGAKKWRRTYIRIREHFAQAGVIDDQRRPAHVFRPTPCNIPLSVQ
jgi:hypothetical protein